MTITIVGGGNPSGPTFPVQRSVRLRASATAYFSRTFGTPTNNLKWTLSGWIKKGGLGTTVSSGDQAFIAAPNGGNADIFFIEDNGTDQFSFFINSVVQARWTPVYRDPSSWYHVVLVYDSANATQANRLLLYINGVQITTLSTAVGISLNQSTTINANAVINRIGNNTINTRCFDGYLTEVNFIDGQALTPTSFGAYNSYGVWSPAKYTGTYGNNGFYLPFNNLGSTCQNYLIYSEQFDNAAWLKPAAPVAPTVTANSTTSPNGSTTADTANYSGATTHPIYQEYTTNVTNGSSVTASVYIKYSSGTSFYLQNALFASGTVLQDGYAFITFSGAVPSVSASNAYMTVSAVDVGNGWYRITATNTNQAGSTANSIRVSIGQNGGASSLYIWGAQLQAGTSAGPYTYTTSSAITTAGINLGADYSIANGGVNTWSCNNISLTAGATYDSMLDVPTLTSNTNANFSTLNPLDTVGGTFSNANLTVSVAAGGGNLAFNTMGMTSGKWYWEITPTTLAAPMIGVADANTAISTRTFNGANGWYYYNNGLKYNSGTGTAYGASYVANDVIGIALDMDAGTLTFYKNNVSQGVAYSGFTGKTMIAALNNGGSGAAQPYNANFGQQPFSYTPPSGFKSLNTYNLPAPTIPNGAQYFAATTYTGNGVATPNALVVTNTVNGTSFQPDFVWVKSRSLVQGHVLEDSVRGTSVFLQTDTTAADQATGGGDISSFNSNGFTLSYGNARTNQNAATYVGWQWKANGTPAVVNTSGSIPSTISANTTAGFSIVTYTGTGALATVGHGLGVAPKMIIVKQRNTTGDWAVYNANLSGGANNQLLLNSTAAAPGASTFWGNLPTSSVFSVWTSATTNTSGGTYVAYCWAEIAGYSKFGSYTGNGSADGPFVYTGFRPRYVMIKGSSFVSNWFVIDTSRDTYNVAPNALRPNLSDVETTGSSTYSIDILSNGFKLRSSAADSNTSSATFIYACFAENPFSYSLAR